MQGVDMRRARFFFVGFRGLDLDTLRFPENDEHILIDDYRATLERALGVVQGRHDMLSREFAAILEHRLKWAGPHQQRGIILESRAPGDGRTRRRSRRLPGGTPPHREVAAVSPFRLSISASWSRAVLAAAALGLAATAQAAAAGAKRAAGPTTVSLAFDWPDGASAKVTYRRMKGSTAPALVGTWILRAHRTDDEVRITTEKTQWTPAPADARSLEISRGVEGISPILSVGDGRLRTIEGLEPLDRLLRRDLLDRKASPADAARMLQIGHQAMVQEVTELWLLMVGAWARQAVALGAETTRTVRQTSCGAPAWRGQVRGDIGSGCEGRILTGVGNW
jgi:hypothetical protein